MYKTDGTTEVVVQQTVRFVCVSKTESERDISVRTLFNRWKKEEKGWRKERRGKNRLAVVLASSSVY